MTATLHTPGRSVGDNRGPGRRGLTETKAGRSRRLPAAIFDVDGVILSSPHERAWREALEGFSDPAFFTTAFYETYVAGKPRIDGARSALEHLGVEDAPRKAVTYAEIKQRRLETLIHQGSVSAFADALRFVQAM